VFGKSKTDKITFILATFCCTQFFPQGVYNVVAKLKIFAKTSGSSEVTQVNASRRVA